MHFSHQRIRKGIRITFQNTYHAPGTVPGTCVNSSYHTSLRGRCSFYSILQTGETDVEKFNTHVLSN